MRIELSTAPTATVLPLAKVREWLAMAADVTVADNLLEDMIDEVTAWAEWRMNRHIATKVIKVWLDYAEIDDEILLPVLPLLSSPAPVVTTYDDDGNVTTVAATNYQVIPGNAPSLALTDSGDWGSDIREFEGMLITASFGAGGDYLYAYDARCTPVLDDFIASGTSTDTAKTTYEIKISTAANPDKYQWRTVTRTAGIRAYSAWSSEIACSTTATDVGTKGLRVRWLAATGHTLADTWVAERYEDLSEYQPANIMLLLRGLAVYWYSTRGLGVMQSADGRMGLPQQLAAMLDSLRVGNA